MTSVRPKLKPETAKAITAWETETGRSVWLTATGEWSHRADMAGVFNGDEAVMKLSSAAAQEGIVTDPYFMQVNEDGTIAGRETLRESIRATGPTVPYGEIF